MLRNCFCSLCVSFRLVTLASMVFTSIEYLEEIVFVSEKADPRGSGKCLNNLRFTLIYRWSKNSAIVTEIMNLSAYLNELRGIFCRREEGILMIIAPI